MTTPARRSERPRPETNRRGDQRAGLRERIAFLAEDARVADRLQGLLADVEYGGKQVHDANVVATMLAHGVGTVVTMNLADFARFERYVSFVEL
jgi:predicted nucleic acid-binding protein